MLTLPEAIRRRPVMYIGTTVEPLANIIEEITGQFIHLGVSKHRIRTDADFIMIEAKEDWLVADKKDYSFADPFNEWVRQYSDHGKNVNLGPRGEVYLTAFYYPYYTVGPAGTLGDIELLDKFSGRPASNYIGRDGRFLLISKQQSLPKNHGINYDVPVQTEAELRNEKMWEKLAKKS